MLTMYSPHCWKWSGAFVLGSCGLKWQLVVILCLLLSTSQICFSHMLLLAFSLCFDPCTITLGAWTLMELDSECSLSHSIMWCHAVQLLGCGTAGSHIQQSSRLSTSDFFCKIRVLAGWAECVLRRVDQSSCSLGKEVRSLLCSRRPIHNTYYAPCCCHAESCLVLFCIQCCYHKYALTQILAAFLTFLLLACQQYQEYQQHRQCPQHQVADEHQHSVVLWC